MYKKDLMTLLNSRMNASRNRAVVRSPVVGTNLATGYSTDVFKHKIMIVMESTMLGI